MRNRVVSAKTVLAVIVAMVAQVLFGVAAPANAQTPVSDSYFDVVATLPDGRAIAEACSSAAPPLAFDSFDSNGVLITPAAELMDGYGFYSGCGGENVAADGTVVTYGYQYNATHRIVAHKDNEILWSESIVNGCGFDADATSPRISADNKVYYAIYDDCSLHNGPELVIRDLLTGAMLDREPLDDVMFVDEYYFRPYLNGYVYPANGTGEMVYLGLDGQKDTSRSYTLSHPMLFARWAIDANGNSIVLSEVNNEPVLVFRDAIGTEVVRELASCSGCYIQNIYASPLGGAVLELVDYSADQYYIEIVSSDVNTPAKLIATNAPTGEGGQIISVDVYGNTLYALNYDIPDAGYYEKDQVGFVLYDSAGNITSQDDTESVRTSNDAFDLIYASSVATSNGHVHAILRRAGQYEMHRFDFAKVGIDYPRGVLLGDTSTPPGLLNYVAMGDSYSSGEGVKPYIDGTDDDPSNTCHRSEKAYPMLLEGYASLSIEVQDFVACSGAETKHIIQEINEDNMELPQAAFITPNTDVVTISIGGNDIGFGTVLSQCTTFDDPDKDNHTPSQEDAVEEANCLSHIANADAQIDTLAFQTRVVDVLEGIKDIGDAYGNSDMRLVVVGYPQLYPEFNDIQETCTWGPWGAAASGAVSGRDVSGYEVAYLRAATEKLNLLLDSIVTAMNDSGVSFVDTQTAFSSHELCTTTPYVLPVVPDVFDPIGRRASFHPNQLGQKAYADIVAKKISLMLQ
ncbi:MAG: SGNH/GDSL hydrolase family protein [Candidatus Saccharimonadales bacterium]